MKVLVRRRAVLVNSALGVALLGASALAYTALDGGTGVAASKVQTRTATVAQGTVLATVSGSGTLASPNDAAEDFTTGGRLTAVKVAVGDQVTKGEVLATVDTTATQQQIDAAGTALTAAQASLAKAEAGTTSTVNHAVALGSGGGVTAISDTTENRSPAPSPTPSPAPGSDPTGSPGGGGQTSAGGGPTPRPTVAVTVPAPQPSPPLSTSVDPAQVAQAEQQVQAAQTNLTNAQAALAGTTLVADTDGTVASIAGRVGDTVAGSAASSVSGGSGGSSSGGSSTKSSTAGGASGSAGAATPSGFIVLTNPSGMQVTADFSELDSLKLKKGQSATVTLNAQPDTQLNATVLAVSSLPVAGSSASAVQYPATLQLAGDTSTLRTGLSASVSVVTGEADNALYVPTDALSGTGSSRTATVVQGDGSTERVDVTVGIEGDSTVQVTGGLTEGEKVQLISTTTSTGNGFPSGGFPGLTGGGLGGRGGGQGGFGGGSGKGGS